MERDRKRGCIRVSYEGEECAKGFGRMETKGHLFDVYKVPGGFVLRDGISGKPLRVFQSSTEAVDYLSKKYPDALIDTVK